MNNVSHKKKWGVYTTPTHADPPPILLAKEISASKSDGDYSQLKLCRDPTTSTLDLYEFRMYLFDHGEPYEFLLFVKKIQMTLAATGKLETEAKVQYICTLVCGEALRQFDLLSSDVKNIETPLDVDYPPMGLAWYFFPVNSLSKQKGAMLRCMKNPRSLKVRRYAARLIYFN